MATVGCATYQGKVSQARNLIASGRAAEAIESLKPLAEKKSDDQLLYVLDYSMALQIYGMYKESSDALIKADSLTDIQDYHSISNIVGATLGSEEMIQYKGESFEKYLINTMNAINFAMLGKNDEAIVECRRINNKLSKMKMEGRKSYELSPFAHYFSAILWESERKWDDAYIAFEQAYKLDPTIPGIEIDLVRAAKRARREETHKKWKDQFAVSEDPKWYDKKMGELVVIFQQGWIPRKGARSDAPRFPRLYPVYSETKKISVSVNGNESKSRPTYDVGSVAIRTLEDDYGSLIARRMGGVVAKAVVADQIRQKDRLLGDLAYIAMRLSDRADLRQWSTLPNEIHLVRIILPAGEYKINIVGLNSDDAPTGESVDNYPVRIYSGQKAFVNWRSLK